MLKKNFDIDKNQFDKLVEELQSGSDEMFNKLFKDVFIITYESIKNKLNISEPDAKEATINAFFNFYNKLKDGKITYNNLKYLLDTMAKQEYFIFFNTDKKEKSFPLIDELNFLIEEEEIDHVAKDEEFNKLEEAVKKLDTNCKKLLDKIYTKGIKTGKIAKSLKISKETFRKRKERCLKKLKNLLS